MQTEQMNFPCLNLAVHFDGESYEPAEDRNRLKAQIVHVYELMSGHQWWSISQLCDAIWKRGMHASQQSVSARIRDLRKERFGAHTVDRRRRNKRGDWEYRLVPVAEVARRQELDEQGFVDMVEAMR